uniref:DUF2132 domain-containing protein n=1 Tax=uncultured Thiotrichaceae bacterium TaxID=298394 RepID=A0A6S6U7J1_9GAMM|nr:MAG: Unknown protein [uncultured Thiotrichaceae bacterium]
MNNELNFKNNPLNGVGLKQLITELVDHYGFEILFAYLNINCFNTNPSIASSVKFLKKTEWAREKVEVFYMYEFKNLPRASSEQFALPPRDRIVPEGQVPGEPAELSLEDAEILREKRAKKADAYDPAAAHRSSMGKRFGARNSGYAGGRDYSRSGKKQSEPVEPRRSADKGSVDPWAEWKRKKED